MTSDSKNFLRNIYLVIGSIFFSVILAEVALRIALPTPIVWKYPQEYYLYDPEIGHWLKPNQKAFTHDKPVSTNSIGIRDYEYEENKAGNVYRILALGDSQTFGNGLELADTWPKQLESILDQGAGHMRVEVLNAGLPASDTWQHEIIFQRMVAKYHPDAVILAFYVNDVVKKHTPSPHREQTSHTLGTRIAYQLKRSVLLLTLRQTLNSLRQNMTPNRQHSGQQALLMGDRSTDIDERWQQVEQSLSEMKNTSDLQNTVFSLASVPRRDQVAGHMPADAYIQRLESITERLQIPFINLLPPLQELYDEHGKKLFIPWDGHNTKVANHVIAKEISRAILISERGTQ